MWYVFLIGLTNSYGTTPHIRYFLAVAAEQRYSTQYRQCGFSECPSDAKISADVNAHFRQRTATEPPNVIYVQTFNHVVYLSGLVDSVSDVDTAEAVAGETPRVTDVVSSFGMNP
jgi:osmotically-inducible protein OsmY